MKIMLNTLFYIEIAVGLTEIYYYIKRFILLNKLIHIFKRLEKVQMIEIAENNKNNPVFFNNKGLIVWIFVSKLKFLGFCHYK